MSEFVRGQKVWCFAGEVYDIIKKGNHYEKIQTTLVEVSDDGFSALIETNKDHKAVRLALLFDTEEAIDDVLKHKEIKMGDLVTAWCADVSQRSWQAIYAFRTGIVVKVNKASVDIVDTATGKNMRANRGSCVRISKK